MRLRADLRRMRAGRDKMPPLTSKQEAAVAFFLERVQADHAGKVAEVRLFAEPPPPAEETTPDLGLLVRVAIPAAEAGALDHALDNVACEVSLTHDVLIALEFLHAGEADHNGRGAEPGSRRIYPTPG